MNEGRGFRILPPAGRGQSRRRRPSSNPPIPITLLVAVVLSAQATDASVNIATRALFEHVKTPRADGRARRGGAARRDQDHRPVQHQGEERHRAQPGADRRSRRRGAARPAKSSKRCPASAARPPMSCSTPRSARRRSRSTRTSSASATAPASRRARPSIEVELKLEKVVPQPFRRDAHHWLILHGRYTCKARMPECWRCPVIDLCRYKPKTPPPRSG